MIGTGWRTEGFMPLGLVERVAMAICKVRNGPLENGSWAKLEQRDKDRLRMEAVAAIEECKVDPFYDEPIAGIETGTAETVQQGSVPKE